jgi:hypothetical protein
MSIRTSDLAGYWEGRTARRHHQTEERSEQRFPFRIWCKIEHHDPFAGRYTRDHFLTQHYTTPSYFHMFSIPSQRHSHQIQATYKYKYACNLECGHNTT